MYWGKIDRNFLLLPNLSRLGLQNVLCLNRNSGNSYSGVLFLYHNTGSVSGRAGMRYPLLEFPLSDDLAVFLDLDLTTVNKIR